MIYNELKYILNNVNNWLKFAEAKNGALLVIDITLLIGLYGIVSSDKANGYIFLVIPAMILILISAICCIIPHFPILTPADSKREKNECTTYKNCHYFGHLAQLHEEDLIPLLCKKLNIVGYSPTEADMDLCNQIITNSTITMRKYNYFTKGLSWMLYSICYFIIITFVILFF